MTTAVTTTSTPTPLDVSSITNPATPADRTVSGTITNGQVSGSTVTQAGDQSVFSNATQTLGKQDFLNLLVTQLKYQDPLQPSDDTQFISQLAQFSALEGTQNLETSVDNLGTQLNTLVTDNQQTSQAISQASATNLIGKQVSVKLDSINWDPSQNTPITFQASATPGTQSVVSIVDANQNVMDAFALPTSGQGTINWIGQTQNGSVAPAGTYQIMVTSADGTTDTGYAYTQGPVTGLNFATSGLQLEVGGQQVPMDQVTEITNATTNP